MHWPKTGSTQYHAQLWLLIKGRANKELVVWWVLPNLIPRVFGQKRRHLASLGYPGLSDNSVWLSWTASPPVHTVIDDSYDLIINYKFFSIWFSMTFLNKSLIVWKQDFFLCSLYRLELLCPKAMHVLCISVEKH